MYPQPVAGGQLGVARATESGGWHPWAPRSGRHCTLLAMVACRPFLLRGPTACELMQARWAPSFGRWAAPRAAAAGCLCWAKKKNEKTKNHQPGVMRVFRRSRIDYILVADTRQKITAPPPPTACSAFPGKLGCSPAEWCVPWRRCAYHVAGFQFVFSLVMQLINFRL